MCDTVLAAPGSTTDQVMLFGKNSDRQRNEAQNVEYFPGADHQKGARLRCTYLSIPQAVRTHAVLLCRPFWIWGAEMGANEFGVVIGNEGLHSRGPAPENEALIGMDLLRLALERAATAAEAVEMLTQLLREHGQGGNCGHLTPSFYHNAFMIADAREAFILETVYREWVCKRVSSGIRAISNGYSIGPEADRTSPGLIPFLQTLGGNLDGQIDYANALAAPNVEHIGFAGARRARSEALLRLRDGHIDVAHIMRVLRDHGVDSSGGHSNPWQARERTLCMHAGADERPAQTTNAMASEIRRNGAIHWVTGTAAPCLSVFKPVLLDVGVPTHGRLATDRFDPNALWWRHEKLHRAALMGDFARILGVIAPERDALEAEFRRRIEGVLDADSSERTRVVWECWSEAAAAEDRWLKLLSAPNVADVAYATWHSMNELAGMRLDGDPLKDIERLSASGRHLK